MWIINNSEKQLLLCICIKTKHCWLEWHLLHDMPVICTDCISVDQQFDVQKVTAWKGHLIWFTEVKNQEILLRDNMWTERSSTSWYVIMCSGQVMSYQTDMDAFSVSKLQALK